jgi:hypothetical protein
MIFEIAGIVLASGSIGALLASLFTHVVNLSDEDIAADAIPFKRLNKHYSVFSDRERLDRTTIWRQSLGTIHEE